MAQHSYDNWTGRSPTSNFPEMAANVLPGYRRAIMRRFPFCVVYRIRGQEVEVIALFPTRADPDRLLARLAPLHTH